MEQKAIANVIFIPVLIIGLFLMFYFASGNKLIIYIFAALFPLTIYYLYLVYFSKINPKKKKLLEWIPLVIISGTIGILCLIVRIIMLSKGIWGEVSIIDLGIFLLFLSIYGSMQATTLFKSKYLIEKDLIHFYSNIEKTYNFNLIYAIEQQELGVLVFNSEKEYLEYVKTFSQLNKKITKTGNAPQDALASVNLQDATYKQYGFILLADFSKLSNELLRRKYQNKQNLWINPKYINSRT